ncbi:GNAT family N-acetyltransferase [Pantoea agglomerans]|uniref:GNAT family N-acetyltransferase n=1 Tax=Enterobacter agglomerans TaxID=549 RepID=UPI0010BFED13|nr:GNAT family N-acetyltransferase [Pantoea agglomerans]MBD8143150.1 GNAT family N-acetyltransferase [Pantoea agglomerans]MBD8182098.1 GNAT family N-acetyltransferase [Pantoea agglomerans]MBD8222721.1 GNAT family N-acetyltransferase [Pantoea agglomerans]TKJ55952.1 GNAT family N-acetyltransferase [Pantoea agglomerans]TKK18204.1 GNAT family N-acetyltransferase [Pantoea agglomerans]
MITLEKADPRSAESQLLITKLSAELAAITGDNGKSNFTMDSMDEERSLWVLARNNKGDAVGCGAIRPLTEHIAELKRMFSDRSSPAIGNALLIFLEKSALSMGYDQIWLATRSVNHKAVNFYQKNSYERIDNYGPYVNRDEAVCFAKILPFRR